jgi:hypothetical protein
MAAVLAALALAANPESCQNLAEFMPCAAESMVTDAAGSSTAPCASCIQHARPTAFGSVAAAWPTFFRSTHPVPVNDHPIYLVLLVPPGDGSSALEGLLSSSPAVSTMCNHCSWQCEATWSLCHQGIGGTGASPTYAREILFPCDIDKRWDPTLTNWSAVYDAFWAEDFWDDPTKPLLMDKSPPNLIKVPELVEYFNQVGADYRFIAMARHPCTASHDGTGLGPNVATEPFSHMFERAEAAADPAKFFKISYDDLVTRPDLVAQELLDWMPELVSVDFAVSYIHGAEMSTLGLQPDEPPPRHHQDGHEDDGTQLLDPLSLGSMMGTQEGRKGSQLRFKGGHEHRRQLDREPHSLDGQRDVLKGAQVPSNGTVAPVPDTNRELSIAEYMTSEHCSLEVHHDTYDPDRTTSFSQCKYCSNFTGNAPGIGRGAGLKRRRHRHHALRPRHGRRHRAKPAAEGSEPQGAD